MFITASLRRHDIEGHQWMSLILQRDLSYCHSFREGFSLGNSQIVIDHVSQIIFRHCHCLSSLIFFRMFQMTFPVLDINLRQFLCFDNQKIPDILFFLLFLGCTCPFPNYGYYLFNYPAIPVCFIEIIHYPIE